MAGDGNAGSAREAPGAVNEKGVRCCFGRSFDESLSRAKRCCVWGGGEEEGEGGPTKNAEGFRAWEVACCRERLGGSREREPLLMGERMKGGNQARGLPSVKVREAGVMTN